MNRSKRFLTIVSSLVAMHAAGFANPVIGQDTREVRGRVLEASTGDPIQDAHIFYSGTTIGDTSDAEGRFQLPYPLVDQFDIVVSMMGFSSEKRHIERLSFDFAEQIFELSPATIALEDVYVVGDAPKEWKQNLKRFEDIMFSTTEYGNMCDLENPEVLLLSYNTDSESINASATMPLRILNRALGYHITIHDLKLEGNERGYQFSGEIHFEESSSSSVREKIEFEERRAKIYRGSLRHFLRALVQDRLEEEGFAAYHVSRRGQTLSDTPITKTVVVNPDSGSTISLISPGSSPASYFISFTGALFIHNKREDQPEGYYRYLENLSPRITRDMSRKYGSNQLSWITLPLYTAEVDTSGIVFANIMGFPIAHHGYWAWERFGELLPTDYVPPEEP